MRKNTKKCENRRKKCENRGKEMQKQTNYLELFQDNFGTFLNILATLQMHVLIIH